MRYPAVVTKEGKNLLADFPTCPGCHTFAPPGHDIEDARSWYRLPAPMIDALERDRKSRKVKDFREYLVGLLLERYVAMHK